MCGEFEEIVISRQSCIGDCEQQGGKLSRLLSGFRPRIRLLNTYFISMSIGDVACADKTFLTFGIVGVLDLLVLVDAVAPHGIAVLIELHVPNVLSLYTCNRDR